MFPTGPEKRSRLPEPNGSTGIAAGRLVGYRCAVPMFSLRKPDKSLIPYDINADPIGRSSNYIPRTRSRHWRNLPAIINGCNNTFCYFSISAVMQKHRRCFDLLTNASYAYISKRTGTSATVCHDDRVSTPTVGITRLAIRWETTQLIRYVRFEK